MQAKDSDMYQEWLYHPLTQALLTNAKEDMENIQDGWKQGAFLSKSDIENGHSAGMVESLDMLIEAVESGGFFVEDEE